MKCGDEERKRIDYLMTEDVFSSDKRFEDCLVWYAKAANTNKCLYYVLTLFSGICPILSAGVTTFAGNAETDTTVKVMLIVLSCMASITVLINNMTKSHERWIRYRGAAENLKKIRSEYLISRKLLYANAGTSAEKAELELEFIKNIENYMANENIQWQEYRRGIFEKEESQDNKNQPLA